MNRTTSPRGSLLFFVSIALVSACRQIAGYDDSVVFDDRDVSHGGTGGGSSSSDGGPFKDTSVNDDVSAATDADSSTDVAVSEANDNADRLAPPADGPAPDVADARGVEGAVTSDASDGGAVADGAAQDVTVDTAVVEPDASPCDPMPPKVGTNLIANPDFEDDIEAGAGWSFAYGGKFVVSSTQAHCGTHSGEMTNRSQFFNAFEYAIALPADTSYSYSLWVMQDGPSDIWMGFQAFSAAGTCANSFGNVTYAVVPPNVWTHLTGTLAITSGCPTSYLYVVQQYVDAAAYPNLYVDDVYVIQ